MKYAIFIIIISLTSCAAHRKKENTPTPLNPRLTRPEVTKVWVPDHISGDEYELGHWKYIINKNSTWTKED
ncbi:MAG: hypothetical protein M9962_11085 [Oligoflexia bacterium]|nr:hypothetical protein [Oligoflexia bacterium]